MENNGYRLSDIILQKILKNRTIIGEGSYPIDSYSVEDIAIYLKSVEEHQAKYLHNDASLITCPILNHADQEPSITE